MSELGQSRRRTDLLLSFCKLLLILAFAYPFFHYGLFSKQANNATLVAPNNKTLIKRVKVLTVVQPACPTSHILQILRELCRELFLQRMQCTPEDYHNLEKHKVPPPRRIESKTHGEPRGTIVGCVAAGLLLTSLGAAFLELYKAKSSTGNKSNKPTMSRKCSLADLTVLKHNRKELVRRESVLEMQQQDKPLGFRPPPLYRRCSFPEYSNGYYQDSRRASIEPRRLSVIDSRRGSVADSRKASIVDNESPERRHWSRLVHRH